MSKTPSTQSTVLMACSDKIAEFIQVGMLPSIVEYLKDKKKVDVTVEELATQALGIKQSFAPPSLSGEDTISKSKTRASGSSNKTGSSGTSGTGSMTCTFVITRGNKKGDPCGKPSPKGTGLCSNHSKDKKDKTAGSSEAATNTLHKPDLPTPPSNDFMNGTGNGTGKAAGKGGIGSVVPPKSIKGPDGLDCEPIEIEEDGKDVPVLRDRKHGFVIDGRNNKFVVVAIDPQRDGNPRVLDDAEKEIARGYKLEV